MRSLFGDENKVDNIPGFHEAIGDTMALAVNTPTHLQDLGLLPSKSTKTADEDEENIAYLFHVALEKV